MREFQFREQLAAQTPYILANVHRRSGAPEIPITHFLPLSVATKGLPEKPAEEPLPPGMFMGKFGPVRIAPPGARPPSTRPPGVKDDVIERFDAHMRRGK